MNKKQIGGLVIAVFLFMLTGVVSVFTNQAAEEKVMEAAGTILTGGYEFRAPGKEYIAIVRVSGVMEPQVQTSVFEQTQGYQHMTTLEYVDDLMEDKNNIGILLYVDSPGGTVYEGDELYRKLMQYKETTTRPIWGYMAHYAASGGYYVSAAADTIYANPNTVTGSIGIIMSGYDLTGLYEKLGIKYFSITSGDYKDSSQISEGQLAIYQSQIDEAYQQFLNIVAASRELPADEVKRLADGRTYTANQAKENGLIDEIALFEDMKAVMGEKLRTDTFYELKQPYSLVGSLFAKVEQMLPKSEAQVLTELAKEKESGVLMYYAEQLR